MAAATSTPLVLLPGMLCSPALLAPLVQRLPGRLGATLVPGAASVDACVADVLDAAPPRFDLLGHSLGGVVAMALVRAAPERVGALVLVSTSARPPTDDQRGAWAATRAALAAGTGAREVQRSLLPVLLRPGGDPALEEAALAMADEVGAATLDSQLAAQATRVDERVALGRVAAPTLVLVGADDVLTPVERSAEITALVPGARLEVVPGAGHLPTLDAPAAVAAVVARFLGGHGLGGHGLGEHGFSDHGRAPGR